MSASISSTGQIAARLLSDAADSRLSNLRPKADTPDASTRSAPKIITITISSSAQKGVAASSVGHPTLSAESIAKYAECFPPRDGYSTSALAASVMNPRAESSSAGKTQAEAAADARAVMDAKYASMAADGKPFDPNAVERDHYTLFGEFDRRTLNAIATNVGEQFSPLEQELAFALMDQQYKLGIGLHEGPAIPNPQTWDVLKDDITARLAFANQWLEQVSDEEKASTMWSFEKAYMEIALEQSVIGDLRLAGMWGDISASMTDAPDLGADNESPLVKLIKAAIYEPREGSRSTNIRNLEDLKDQEWMANYRDQVDEAARQTRAMYRKETSAA